MEPLLTPRQLATLDRAAPACGMPLAQLMDNAGRAIAHTIRRHYAPSRVLVLAGPGNNGGDGYVAARLLAQWGWPVAIAPVLGPPTTPEAAAAASRWHGPLLPANLLPTDPALHRADLVIDALFGAGLSRDLPPTLAALLAASRTLVAVDILSGIDGTTGAARGVTARANLTITFVARKPGHLLYPGRAHSGLVLCADIAMPAAARATITPNLWRNTPGLWRLPVLDPDGHKYQRGSLTLLSGLMPGAALLAANAARRAGAGLVTIAAPTTISAPPGIITTTDPLATLLADPRWQVFLIGPGLGVDRAGPALDALITAARTIVADADALTACADAPNRLRGTAIITPHHGEFRRLFPALTHDKLTRDKLTAARSAAAQTGAVVIYKGADTIIAAPDGRAAINDNAPPSLATAGAGDVLAGIAAALLARGMTPFEAACAAVWLHADAATRAGAGLIAEDIASQLPTAMAQATLSLI